jgi:hypothetical protein
MRVGRGREGCLRAPRLGARVSGSVECVNIARVTLAEGAPGRYDPTTAQFLTRDPLTRDTREPYAYAFDSPLTLADPTGLCGGYDLTGPNAWPPGSIVDVTQPPPPPDPAAYSGEDTTLTLSGAAGWLLANAGTIGSFCDLGSFIPGVDAVAGPCALVFGTINGVEDIAGGKPVQGVLELAGGGLTVRSAALAGRAERLTEAGNITEGVGAWNAHLTTEHCSQVLDLASGSLDLNARTRAYFNQQNGNQGGG